MTTATNRYEGPTRGLLTVCGGSFIHDDLGAEFHDLFSFGKPIESLLSIQVGKVGTFSPYGLSLSMYGNF